MRTRLIRDGDSALLLIPADVVAQMSLQDGDEVELVVLDGSLIVRSASEVRRSEMVSEVIDDVLARRKKALERLAE